MGASAIAPFKQLGESLSQGVLGGLDGLKSDAQQAIEGAQTQLGESVTETIGNPLQVRDAVVDENMDLPLGNVQGSKIPEYSTTQ